MKIDLGPRKPRKSLQVSTVRRSLPWHVWFPLLTCWTDSNKLGIAFAKRKWGLWIRHHQTPKVLGVGKQMNLQWLFQDRRSKFVHALPHQYLVPPWSPGGMFCSYHNLLNVGPISNCLWLGVRQTKGFTLCRSLVTSTLCQTWSFIPHSLKVPCLHSTQTNPKWCLFYHHQSLLDWFLLAGGCPAETATWAHMSGREANLDPWQPLVGQERP